MRPLSQVPVETIENVEINMAPLIDMVFLLLIFFAVSSVFVEETGVTVQKPTAATAEQLEKNSVLLAVTADGRVVYGGRELGLNGVRGLVSRLLQVRDLPVILLADQGAAAGVLVDVIDECKLGGAKKVSLAARRE